MSTFGLAPDWNADDVATLSSSVSVVITTYNDAHYLEDALASVIGQSRAADVIVVVDDGSESSPAPIVSRFPGVRLVRQENAGLAASRNLGLAQITTDYVLFLDADDTLAEDAISSGLECFRGNPGAGFVYGGYRLTNSGLSSKSELQLARIDDAPLAALCEGNRIGMHGAVMYDRLKLAAMGGFDETLRRCEDYDVYLRMASAHRIVSHSNHVANYRIHNDNMSQDPAEMLDWAQIVHNRYRPGRKERSTLKAWKRGRVRWKRHYVALAWNHDTPNASGRRNDARVKFMTRAPLETLAFPFASWLRSRLSKKTKSRIRRMMWGDAPPAVGNVAMGDLDRLTPISDDFGWERGTPIDRYYIERFLAGNARDIRGSVLEIGDDAYSQNFGSEITSQDILHRYPGHANATIVGDISHAGTLPQNAFDCIVLCQTLHLIFDMAAAVRQLRSALKPGGVLLVTVPGVSAVDNGEWGDSWYWSLTSRALKRLLLEAFPAEEVEVATFGNVYSATCFLQGMAQEDVQSDWLSHTDTAFPVVVTARAVRPAPGIDAETAAPPGS